MSRNYSNLNQSNNKFVKPVKPFCKVCQDAGKTEAEYTSHFVRRTTDPNSEVICPTLLATECRYCHGLGHTLSRCPVRENNNRRREEEARLQEAEARRQEEEARRQEEIRRQELEAIRVAQKNNKYSVFEEEDAEQEPEPEPEPEPIDEFPALCGLNCAAPKSAVSFATAFKSSAAPANKNWQAQPSVCRKTVEEKYEYSSRYEEEEEYVSAINCDSDDDEDHYKNSVLKKYEEPAPCVRTLRDDDDW